VSDGLTQEHMVAEAGTVALINGAEINQQIATAKRYPRSLKAFLNEALQMATLNERVAQECIYALPRQGKTIEGPSARLAEIIACAWGNSRAGARVVDDKGDFVTAQGVFHDLERNVAITYEVQRRITDKSGKRFNSDMIGVTANAACSIALRNAILKGVPKAFWSDIYDQARAVAVGNSQTLANRRARALQSLQKFGATPEMVFAKLGVTGEADITIDHLSTLFGIATALRDGDSTVEEVFDTTAPASEQKEKAIMPDEEFSREFPKWQKLIQDRNKTATQIIAMIATRNALTDQQQAAIRKVEADMETEGGVA
jgi:hypothetical protein